MGPTRLGVPLTSCAESIPYEILHKASQGKVKLNRLPANSIADTVMFFRGTFLVSFSPTLPTCTSARVCGRHFLPPPRRKREKK
ncbi:hypothetical protein EVAR_79609_1 [Eumeta japonica]|uniref:Uncharacterized protein n=1 Tax=Eumeta variegata TaxID=151549 RepID=A0A4C1UFL1_EUMVA|nr:hypothetical protein EVAR_79609_1 [Eumeta japonica]